MVAQRHRGVLKPYIILNWDPAFIRFAVPPRLRASVKSAFRYPQAQKRKGRWRFASRNTVSEARYIRWVSTHYSLAAASNRHAPTNKGTAAYPLPRKAAITTHAPKDTAMLSTR